MQKYELIYTQNLHFNLNYVVLQYRQYWLDCRASLDFRFVLQKAGKQFNGILVCLGGKEFNTLP